MNIKRIRRRWANTFLSSMLGRMAGDGLIKLWEIIFG